MFLLGFPLLLIPVAIYNIIAFLMPGVSFTDPLFSVPMLSNVELIVSAGDVLVIFAILILFVEIVKATRLGSRSIVDHLLSLMLFIAMLGELMIVRQAATSTFLLLVTLSFVDVIGGFSVAIRTSQHNIALEGIERA
ncbi:MAG: hypothetical protein GEU91_22605 [Rhizobiales bacterium]|nr:hypothetical protein [Hyphomicrobiales bacterium]